MFGEKIGEQCLTVGQGDYALGGAFGAFRTWRTAFPSLKKVPYLATNQTGSIWEVGWGTLTYGTPSDTLSRNLIASSTTTLINWAVTPYFIMSAPVAFVLSFLTRGGAATDRPEWLEQGADWKKFVDGDSWLTGVVQDLIFDGQADIERGRYEAAGDLYASSPRRLWVDKGAANYNMTIADIGRIIMFDTTLSARTYSLLAGDTVGVKHGFAVQLLSYGSNVNGLVLDPSGSEAIDHFAAAANVSLPPNKLVTLRWDALKTKWRTDVDWSVRTPLIGFISPGALYKNSTVDANNDIDFEACSFADDTGSIILNLPAITKQLDANWVIGTDQGGRDTGSIADGWWALWGIGRTDQTGSADLLFSQSGTSPTMPTNYTYKRLLGWVYRSTNLLPFHTYERGTNLELEWDVLVDDVDMAFTTSRQTFGLVRCPPAVCLATLSVFMTGIASLSNVQINISNPAQTNGTVATSGATNAIQGGKSAPFLSSGGQVVNGNNWDMVQTHQVRTDATGQVSGRANVAPASNVKISVIKFEINRRG